MSERKNYALSPEVAAEQNAIIADIRIINEENYAKGFPRKKAFVETYGCQQNVSDSEILMGMLINMGYSTARAVADRLRETDMLCDASNAPECEFYVSDVTAGFSKISKILLGNEIDNQKVNLVDISKYE